MNEIESLKEELKQVKLAYQAAAQMSQFKAGFLARTSHELRSPLGSLMGLHQLILSDLCDSPEEEREFISQAYQYAQKLMQLIDDVIAVAKTEYGTSKLILAPIELGSIFSYLHNLTYLQAANRSLQLEITSPEVKTYVLADQPRFLQVLVSLVDTSISFLEEGKIKVSAHSEPESELVKITIDMPCPASIWSEPTDLLQQTPAVTKEAVKTLSKTLEFSPGMKLLLAQKLLETMAGNLEVVELPSADNNQSFTQLQCSIPLASETVRQDWLED